MGAQKHLVHVLDNAYAMHAKTSPGPNGFMTPMEFNQMTSENGGLRWEDSDLKLIFNALSSTHVWRVAPGQDSNNLGMMDPYISYQDLQVCVKGGVTCL